MRAAVTAAVMVAMMFTMTAAVVAHSETVSLLTVSNFTVYPFQETSIKWWLFDDESQRVYRLSCNATIYNESDLVAFIRGWRGAPLTAKLSFNYTGVYTVVLTCSVIETGERLREELVFDVVPPEPRISGKLVWGRSGRITIELPYPFTGDVGYVLIDGEREALSFRNGVATVDVERVEGPVNVTVNVFGAVYNKTLEPELPEIVVEGPASARPGDIVTLTVYAEDEYGRYPLSGLEVQAVGPCSAEAEQSHVTVEIHGAGACSVILRKVFYEGEDGLAIHTIIAKPLPPPAIPQPPPAIADGDSPLHYMPSWVDVFTARTPDNTYLVKAVFPGNTTHAPAEAVYHVSILEPYIEYRSGVIVVENAAPGGVVEAYAGSLLVARRVVDKPGTVVVEVPMEPTLIVYRAGGRIYTLEPWGPSRRPVFDVAVYAEPGEAPGFVREVTEKAEISKAILPPRIPVYINMKMTGSGTYIEVAAPVTVGLLLSNGVIIYPAPPVMLLPKGVDIVDLIVPGVAEVEKLVVYSG